MHKYSAGILLIKQLKFVDLKMFKCFHLLGRFRFLEVVEIGVWLVSWTIVNRYDRGIEKILVSGSFLIVAQPENRTVIFGTSNVRNCREWLYIQSAIIYARHITSLNQNRVASVSNFIQWYAINSIHSGQSKLWNFYTLSFE